MENKEWPEAMKKDVVTTSVEKLLEGFVRVDMPPDVIASIGMSIVGSIIASSPEDSPFRSSSILSLEQLAFKMRHLKDEDIDKTDPNGVFI